MKFSTLALHRPQTSSARPYHQFSTDAVRAPYKGENAIHKNS